MADVMADVVGEHMLCQPILSGLSKGGSRKSSGITAAESDHNGDGEGTQYSELDIIGRASTARCLVR